MGEIARTPAEAREITSRVGGRVVIKAQVHAGGRGKTGGIKFASSPQEAERATSTLLGSRLVTSQTGPYGRPVSIVLVEDVVDIDRELYIGITIDASQRMPVVIASQTGGLNIEEVARQRPEDIVRSYIDPATDFQPFHGQHIARGLGLESSLVKPFTDLAANLFRLFQSKDCSLAEINPLAVTKDRRLLALDAKLNFDDNALSRHPEIASLRDPGQEDPLEVQAANLGIRNYIRLDGNIGCIVNGAGLAMAVNDLLHLAGGRPANFLDIGTANNTERVVNAFRILTSDSNVKVVLVNIFGGLARVDVIARGIIEAFKQMNISVPVVIRLAGTNVQEGHHILKESGLNLIWADDMQEAAGKAVAAAG